MRLRRKEGSEGSTLSTASESGDQKAKELASGRVHRALLRFCQTRYPAGFAVSGCIEQQDLRRFCAAGRGVMKLADDFATDEPEVVEMAAYGRGGEMLLDEVQDKWPHEVGQGTADTFVFGDSRPALWPRVHPCK